MNKRWLIGLGFVLASCGTAVAMDPGGGDESTTTQDTHKVFVCKYVGTPGVDERLQTGDNPISVDYDSLIGAPALGQFFQDAQGRSVVIAFDTGQPEPDVSECPAPSGETTTTKATTTTTRATTTTTTADTTTTGAATTTTVADTTTTGATTPSTTTTTLPVSTTSSSTSTTGPSSTTTTSIPGGTTTTTLPTTTTTLSPGLPSTFQFGAVATVCIVEVPTIVINFQNLFPQLAGQTGTLTLADVNGNVVSTQPLVYQPGTSVNVLYPGTRVNANGSIADVPGWNLNADGFWVRDPSDAFLRDGINLTYTVNPTATAFVTYPPESAACANPNGPFPPTATNTPPPGGPFSIPPNGFPPNGFPPSGGTPFLPPTLLPPTL